MTTSVPDNRADVTYYNLTLSSATVNDIGNPYGYDNPVAANIVNSTDPILYNPNEYYGMISRLQFSGYAIPLIQYIVQTPVLDINKGIYSFTLSYGGTDSTQEFYAFQPQLLSPAIPVPPVGTATQQYGEYYFIYDFTWLARIIQECMDRAFTNLQAAVAPALNACKRPLFRFNSDNGRYQMLLDPAFFDSALPTPVQVWWNAPSYVYFEGFGYNNYTYNSPNGKDNLMYIPPYQPGLNSITITGGPDAGTYISIEQQYVSLEYMSPLKSIQVVTRMAVRNEQFNIANSKSGSTIDYRPIVTDFLPDISQPVPGISGYKFTYNATSFTRVFDMLQRSPLLQISAELFWTDFLGNRYPLVNPKGVNAEVKYQFIRKDSSILGNMVAEKSLGSTLEQFSGKGRR